jgi:hypothetical protein
MCLNINYIAYVFNVFSSLDDAFILAVTSQLFWGQNVVKHGWLVDVFTLRVSPEGQPAFDMTLETWLVVWNIWIPTDELIVF